MAGRGTGMPQQNRIRAIIRCLRDNLVQSHRTKFCVEQLYHVAGVEQRATQSKQAERWQMLPRDSTANGRMRGIDEEYFHNHGLFPNVLVLRSTYFVIQSIESVQELFVQKGACYSFEPC